MNPLNPENDWRTRLGLFIILLTTLAKSLRVPNAWCETTWSISYDFGMVKRGLMGTLANPLYEWGMNPKTAVLITSSVATAMWGLVILALTWGICRSNHQMIVTRLTAAAALISAYVILGGHTNGYYDGLVFSLAAGATFLVTRQQHAIAGILLAIGILVHENIILYGIPAVCFSVLITQHRNGESKVLRSALKVLIPPILAFMLVSALQSKLDEHTWLEQIRPTLVERGFTTPEHFQAAHSAFGSTIRYWNLQAPRFWEFLLKTPYIPMVGIPLIALLWAAISKLPQKHRSGLATAAILAATAPVALHAIAWDYSRIWMFPIGHAILILWICSDYQKRHHSELEPNKPFPFWQVTVAVLAIIVGMGSQPHLMDGAELQGTYLSALLGYIPGLGFILWDIQRRLNPTFAST